MDTSVLRGIAEEFFTHLGLDFSGLEIVVQDLEKYIYFVKIQSTDSPLLIGPHGRTLEEIQLLLIQMIEHTTGIHSLIHLEINDYLAEKERKIRAIVDRKVELTHKNGIEQVIYELSGYERKQVHAYISEQYPDIVTKSFDGEHGRELHLKLRDGVSPAGESSTYSSPVTRVADIAEDLSKIDLEGTNI